MPKFIRNRQPMELALLLSPLAAGVLLLLSGVGAGRVYAATGPNDCATEGGSLYCRLTGVLDILYIVAAVLGAVLVAVVVFAWLAYRRNRALEREQERRR